MDAELSKCLLCGEETERGLVILGQAICASCLQKLSTADYQSDVSDILAALRPLSELILARAC
mgnify:CR=1 FL=1|jgi:hypothetical protein